MDMVRWFIIHIYAPYLRSRVILGIAWFGYGEKWLDFEPELDEFVLDVLSHTTALWAETEDPVSKVIDLMIGSMKPVGDYGVNVRSRPTISAGVVCGLVSGQETAGAWDANAENLERVIETVNGVKHDHYWRQVWFGPDENSPGGWVADELVLFTPDPVQEPPPEEPPEQPEPEPEEPQPELPPVAVELTPEHLAAIARFIIDAGLARLVAAEVLSHLGTMLLEIADAEGKQASPIV